MPKFMNFPISLEKETFFAVLKYRALVCVPVEIHTEKWENVLEISGCHVMTTERGEVGKQILPLKP